MIKNPLSGQTFMRTV